MRRGVGLQAIDRHNKTTQQFKQAGTQLAATQVQQMNEQMSAFRAHLESFAVKHRKDLKTNPEFRYHFQKMCQNIGVDPLASNKGFWADLLGVGDFYFELGIRIIEVCLSTRATNGGLLDFNELKRALMLKNTSIPSDDDIVRAIKCLKPLGSGFELIQIGDSKFVQSVPRELNTDHIKVLELAQKQQQNRLTARTIKFQLQWDAVRIQTTLDHLAKDGVLWIDSQDSEGASYWLL